MSRIAENLQAVKCRILEALQGDSRAVTLVAVSKTRPAADVAEALAAGHRDFGENYVQEGLEKIQALRGLGLTWHFIGQAQANKTRVLAEQFDWIHGVDRLRIAERLSAQRPHHAPPLNVCIQVNVGGEASKGGAAPTEVPGLATAMAKLPRLALRGLMCLPPAEDDPERQRHWFAQVRQLLEAANAGGLGLDTLSMGMSGDLESAVLEGATMVRVGTALFGARR